MSEDRTWEDAIVRRNALVVVSAQPQADTSVPGGGSGLDCEVFFTEGANGFLSSFPVDPCG